MCKLCEYVQCPFWSDANLQFLLKIIATLKDDAIAIFVPYIVCDHLTSTVESRIDLRNQGNRNVWKKRQWSVQERSKACSSSPFHSPNLGICKQGIALSANYCIYAPIPIDSSTRNRLADVWCIPSQRAKTVNLSPNFWHYSPVGGEARTKLTLVHYSRDLTYFAGIYGHFESI
jgi:hypothetical protein